MSNLNLDAAAAAISAAQTDFENQSVALSAAQDLAASDEAKIASLQQQLLQAIQPATVLGSPPSQLLTPYKNQQQGATNWILGAGAAGNSAGSTASGTATWTDNADGSATVTLKPNQPWYNCYWYRKISVPHSGARLSCYHVEYRLSAEALSHRNALENEWKLYDGSYQWDFAWQFLFTGTDGKGNYTGTCRLFDFLNRAWLDQKIPFTLTPGQWFAVDEIFMMDPVTKIKTHLGIVVNGVFHLVNWQQLAKPGSGAWALVSVQLDSNGQGASYSCDIQNLNLIVV